MLVRGGRNLGTTSHFPRAPLAEPEEALASFIMQYYAGTEPPPEVLLGTRLKDAAPLAEALASRAGHALQVRAPVRGLAARWVELTRDNAVQALRMRLAQRAGLGEMLADLAHELDLPEPPARLECFDISHTAGEGTVASCVVFGPDGPLKKEYRRFNIAGVTPGDDYAALHQALTRRYRHVREGEVPAPDVLLIDGGLGQIGEVHAALAELGYGDLTLVGVAKGPDRRPGQERLFVYGAPDPGGAAGAFARRASDSAHPRRGASLRDHGTPAPSGAALQRVGAGGDSGTGSRQTPRAAQALRRAAGRDARGRGRFHPGNGNRRDAGANSL